MKELEVVICWRQVESTWLRYCDTDKADLQNTLRKIFVGAVDLSDVDDEYSKSGTKEVSVPLEDSASLDKESLGSSTGHSCHTYKTNLYNGSSGRMSSPRYFLEVSMP